LSEKEEENMANWQALKAQVLADGTIDEAEVEMLRRELYADGQIDREEADVLVALRNEARSVCPAFEVLYFEAIAQHILADGVIDAAEAAWLRQMLFADGKIDEGEKRFLTRLRSEARQVSPEFQQLCAECLK
jgi:hypothetical protein